MYREIIVIIKKIDVVVSTEKSVLRSPELKIVVTTFFVCMFVFVIFVICVDPELAQIYCADLVKIFTKTVF